MKIKVCIEKNWDDFWITDQAFLAQIPTPLKERFDFSVGYEKGCDFLIVLNRPRKNITVDLPPNRIWGMFQEPPNEIFKAAHRGQSAMGRVYNQVHGPERGERFHLAPPYIPWFIDKSWEALQAMPSGEEKNKPLTCITSKTFFYRGHKTRTAFLESLKNSDIEIDLWGRGIRPLDDKYEGLRNYRFALILENYSCPYYWSEKIVDAFLSFCVPIYYGCHNIEDFFPADAMIRIDSFDSKTIEHIQWVTSVENYQSYENALKAAREKILTEHNFFSFVAREIDAFLADDSNANISNTHNGQTTVQAFPISHLQSLVKSYLRKAEIKITKK